MPRVELVPERSGPNAEPVTRGTPRVANLIALLQLDPGGGWPSTCCNLIPEQ